jgi:hypothetical protein
MDTRLYDFMRLDDAYVNAIRENHPEDKEAKVVTTPEQYVTGVESSTFWENIKKKGMKLWQM